MAPLWEMVERVMSSRLGAVVSRRWLLRLGRIGLGWLAVVVGSEGAGLISLMAACSSNQVPVCDSADMAMPLVGLRIVIPSP